MKTTVSPVSLNHLALSKVLNERVHEVLVGRRQSLPPDLADQLSRAQRGT